VDNSPVRERVLALALLVAIVATAASCGSQTSSAVTPALPAGGGPGGRTPSAQSDAAGVGVARLTSMAFYEGEYENTDLPASFMAANYQWTEQGAGAATATAYHNAGGLHAMEYTTPNARDCASNQPGTCNDFLKQLDNLPEEAWLHEQSNKSIRVFSNGQQRNNPLDSVFQKAWTAQILSLLSPSQGGSAAWSSQEGGSVELDTLNWETLNSFTYHGGPQYEITQNSQVTQAEDASISETPTLVVANGMNYDYPQSGGYDAMLDGATSNLAGMFNENAFAINYGSGYMTSSYPVTNAWQNQQDGILDLIARKKFDFAWMEGSASPAHRLYGLASFWLSWSPKSSVLWEDFCAPDKTPKGYCNSTWDDASVVPRQPLATATSDINILKVGSVYVREFAKCYQSGVPLGPCAAVVNPGSSSAGWPTLQQHYSRQIVLPTTSLYGGAKVQWSSGLPSSVGANSAAIVAGGA
jgi:hypothetical protein